MKKYIYSKLILLAAMLTLGTAYAEDPYEEIDGIKWYYSVSNEEASVTEIWSSRDGNSPSGDFVVPNSLGGAPVTRIERYVICPYGNSGLTSVTFPDSLRTMDEGNFMRCSALTNVVFGTGFASFDSCFSECWNISAFVVPEGNPNFSAEGSVLYSKDKKTLVKCCAQLAEFEVPSFVEAIGPNAFSEMKSLASVTFPSGLREIQDRAFYNCNNLASVSLPANLQVIGSSAFSECLKITSIAIPGSVVKIGDNAFARNISLVSLTIAEGVKDVGSFAFSSCDALPAVTIPNSVTNIEGGAFEYCTNLWDVTIGSGVVKIGAGLGDPWIDEWGYENRDSAQPAFGGCDSLMNFKLASGNKVFDEIGGCLFLKNTPKTAKTLAVYPNGREDLYFTGDVNVTKIGEGACAQCNKFTTIDITNSVRDVAAQSFMSCWYLGKVVVNPGVTNIDYGAFMLNMQLADVEIAGTVKTIGEQAFMHCYMPDDEVIGRLVLHEGIEEIGPMAFEMTRDLVEVVIPDSVTKIGYGAFSDVMRLKRLTVGSGVTELPPYFCSAEELKSVTIRGENLKRLGEGAFAYCRSLETINLPASVEFIGEYAFDQCEKLPYISIPASVIDPNAFAYCEELARVDFTDDLRAIGTNAFLRCYDLNNVVIPESVETIEPGAFEKCWSLGTVYLPKKFEGVLDESSVFTGCPLDGEGIVYYGPEGVAYVTVTFMSQGKPVETRKYLANTLDYLPAITADGLAFVGWYNAEEGGTPASDADLSGDVTFYARWVESPFINTGVQEWNPAEDEAFPGAIVWRTGDLTGGEEASASYAVVGPAVVNFQWKQTSNNSDDYLTVYVDGEEAGFTQSADWTKATVQVPESGSHVMTWTYSRYRWSSDPETACAELADIRVTAGTAKTITFDVNGGTLDEDWEATRKVVTILGDLPFADKDGVAFAGWWTERDGGERVTAATKPEGDATYYAHWVELPFKVSGSGKFWLAEDGSWATLRYYEGRDMTASVTIKGPCVISFDWRHDASRYFTSIFRVDGDSKYWRDKDEGWDTVTWTIEDTEEHEIEWCFSWGYSYESGQMLLKNISMGTPYEIAFDPGDNAAIFSSDVDRQELGIGYCMRGGTLGHLPAATSDGYMAFDGWFTAAEGGERVTSETPVTGPATYYAHWVESPVMTYWLRSWLFEPDGSLVSDNDCNEYNSSVAEKEFDGPGTLTFRWRMQSDSGNGYFSFLVTDPTITDYVETNRLTKSSGEWVTERYVFTNENYTWVRWAYGVVGDRGGNEHGWIKDITWVSNVVDTVEWTVSFNANGGELKGDAEKVVTDNFPVGRAPVATKTDYSFVGWFTEAEGGEEVTEETPVTANMTVYAHWTYIEPVTPPASPDWQIIGYNIFWWYFGSDVDPGCVMSWEVDEGRRNVNPKSSTYGSESWAPCSATCTVYRDGVAIAEVARGNEEMTWFSDLDVEPGTKHSYSISAHGKSTDAIELTCHFVFRAEIGTNEVTLAAEGRQTKVAVEVSKVTADSSTFAYWDNPECSESWLHAAIEDSWRSVAISADENETGESREGVVSIPCGGYKWQISVRQAAKGEVDPQPEVWNVTFDANGGVLDGDATKSVTNGCAVGALPSATKTDYSFDGWYTEAEGGEQVTLEAVVTGDVTYYAHWTPVPIDGLAINVADSYEAGQDGAFELDLLGLVLPATPAPKLTVKGLPSGIKYDAKTGKISGKATKPGVSTVTISATNAKVTKPVTAEFQLTVPNFTAPVFTAAELADSYDCAAGAAPDLAAVAKAVVDGGWKLAVSGLPSGIKYDSKNGVLTGVATKEGVFTVTFTATKGSGKAAEKEVATATFEVAFPTLALAVEAYGEASATNAGKVAGGGKYPVGAKVTLKATPDKGKVFAGWFDAEGNPLAGAADYRTASFPYVATDADVTLTAKFATAAEDIASLKVTLSDAKTDDDGTYELDLGACVVSASLPKLAVKGLPTGLKFDTKTLKITGKATKPGVYPVKVEATNTSVKKATDASTGEFELKVPNFTTDTFKAAGLDTDGKYVLAAGVLPGDIADVVNAVAAGGWTLKIDGLPAGVKFDAKKNVFSGVATKEGFFTVTFTATKGSGKTAEKEVATATFEVAYPTLTLEIAAYDDETATNKCKVAGGGKYAAGAKVTLKATPDKGKVFVGWYGLVNTACCGMPPSYEFALLSQSPSYAYVATEEDVTLTAKFATEDEDKANLKVEVSDDATDADGTYELDLGACVESLSVPKLAVKGLPAGLKFDAKTGLVTGKATKPGVYAVKVEATNTSVKKATAASTGEFKLTVPNFTCAALPKLKAETDAYGMNFAGVAFDPALVDCTPAEEGWTVKVAGLPTGLKYDAKTGKIAGVSTAKPGSYTVTFTATKGKEKQEATITLNVDALPDWAVGNFDGATDDDDGVVSATVAANGKVTVKVLVDGATLALSAASFDSVELPKSEAESPVFVATVVGKVGKALVTNEVELTSAVVDDVTVGVASGTVVSETPVTWTAWQNLWKRADTKAAQPVFKASFDRTVELGEKGDLDNTVKLTFKKDGVVSFAGKVGGTKVSGSSQLVNDGTGWSATLYAPAKAPFDGWCETFAVTLETDDKNVVTNVTVETASAVAPLWAVGEYVGYGNVYKPNKTGLDEYLYGMLYVDVAEDLTFTGRFEPVDRSGSCPFSGKFTPFGGGGAPGYQADRVTITVKGVQMSIGFSVNYKPYADKEQGYGEIFGWSNYVSEDEERFCPTRVWQNVWKQENLAEERPTFAEGTVLTIEPQYEAGDSLDFAFSTDGKSVAVTGQVDGKAVDTTATIGVEWQGEGKCQCYLYFMSFGHVYSLTFTIPSSGVVSSGDITLDGAWNTYFGMINAW